MFDFKSNNKVSNWKNELLSLSEN